MIAWVCPAATVRSTPRRISRCLPSPSVTLTCRSRISRVAIALLSWSLSAARAGARERDVHVIALDLYRVGRYRLGGGWTGRLAGAQVEAGSVQPAFHRVVVDLALGQRDFLVRTHVVDRVHLALGAHHGDGHARDLHPERALVGHVAERTRPDEFRGLAHEGGPVL